MIAFPSGARVWLATGRTDMRKGFGSLALMAQEGFKRDPHAGDPVGLPGALWATSDIPHIVFAVRRRGSHCAPHFQVSGNIGSWFS